MARASYSPLGTWRGRAGGQVYRVRNGVQVVSSYQPAVSNPRTNGQLMQRAKMALAGKLSSILTDEMIYGLASSKTERRAWLMSDLVKKSNAILDPTIVDPSEVRFIGRINPSNIVLSRGFDYINASSGVISVSGGEGGDPISIDASTLGFLIDLGNESNKVLLVDIYGNGQNTYTAAESYELGSTFLSLTITNPGVHRLYAIPVNAEVANIGEPLYGNVINKTEAGVTEYLQVNGDVRTLQASAAYGKSVYLGNFTIPEP